MAAFRSIIAAGMIAAALTSGSAQATPVSGGDDVVYDLNQLWNGTAPLSAKPWMTATFHTVSAGTVTLTLVASLEQANEYIDAFAFNVSPGTITPSNLSISASPSTNPTLTGTFASTQNQQNINGGGDGATGFDVLLTWATSNANDGIARFNGTDTVTLTITDLADGITAQSFKGKNTGSMNAYVAAHIQGIAGSGESASGTIYSVSEPNTVALFAAGLLGIGLIRRRMNGSGAF